MITCVAKHPRVFSFFTFFYFFFFCFSHYPRTPLFPLETKTIGINKVPHETINNISLTKLKKEGKNVLLINYIISSVRLLK